MKLTEVKKNIDFILSKFLQKDELMIWFIIQNNPAVGSSIQKIFSYVNVLYTEKQ